MVERAPLAVRIGERYVGWGKTWRVVRVWPQGVVDAVNVADPSNMIRWPIDKFQTLERKP